MSIERVLRGIAARHNREHRFVIADAEFAIVEDLLKFPEDFQKLCYLKTKLLECKNPHPALSNAEQKVKDCLYFDIYDIIRCYGDIRES